MKNLVLIISVLFTSVVMSQDNSFTINYQDVPAITGFYMNGDFKMHDRNGTRVYTSSRSVDSDANISDVISEYKKMCELSGGDASSISMKRIMRDISRYEEVNIYSETGSRKYNSHLYISNGQIVAELIERF
jgi:hypothetical protein